MANDNFFKTKVELFIFTKGNILSNDPQLQYSIQITIVLLLFKQAP